MSKDKFDRSQAERTFEFLRGNDEVAEIRMISPGGGGVASGYFDNPEDLADKVKHFSGEMNIYITLNPVLDDLLARCKNDLRENPDATTSDDDITRLKWLMVDVDPERPSGISSTEEELEKSIDLAREIKSDLSGLGWPEPALARSGNGAHLLYSIDLPNDDESRKLTRGVLDGISFRHSTPDVKVDRSTHSPAQLCKLYGTVAIKGDDTGERPHRLSRLLDIPEEVEDVPRDKLEMAKGWVPPEKPQGSSLPAVDGLSGKGEDDLEPLLEEAGTGIARQKRWNGNSTLYILEVCPWDEGHTDRSAYIINFDGGGYAAGCHHDSCSDKDWHSFRELIDPEFGVAEAGINDDASRGKNGRTQFEVLNDIIQDAEFFINELNKACCKIKYSDHHEVWEVESKHVEDWLLMRFLQETGSAPSSENLNKIRKVMRAKASGSGNERKLSRRVAEHSGNFYYDLVDDKWRAVRIVPGGAEVVDDAPPLFHRTKNMQEQPTPDFSGDVEKILDHITLNGKGSQLLYLVYLVSCFIPVISHPVLVVHGEKGSAKSTFIKMTRTVVDPARVELMTMPNSQRDLIVSLRNNYMASFDNLSSLSKKKSDIICQASTGGALMLRKLYEDTEETIMEFKRCVALNGINLVTTEPDIIDRSIIFELERIGEDNYVEESKLWEEFENDRPEIVGGAIRVLSEAMEIYPEVELSRKGRMADFTLWGYAIAEALGYDGGDFVDAYFRNQGKTNEEIIESHPVAAAVKKMMRGQEEESGLVSEIYSELKVVASKNSIATNSDLWPASASALSRRLKQIKSNLEKIGITYEKKKKYRGKVITFYNDEAEKPQVSDPDSSKERKITADMLKNA